MNPSRNTLLKPAPLMAAGALLTALALTPAFGQSADATYPVPAGMFAVPEGLEVTVWARSPMLFNPTNLDVDQDGRLWVAEGVNYRRHFERRPEGDRIVVLEDTNGDGQADSSHTFVQEKALVAPLGVAVFDNVVVVSQPPDLIVYTDVNRNRKFEPGVDKREVLLTGFSGKNHDHSLHSVTAGPDGRWYFNSGNCGGRFTDKSGKTFRIAGPYQPKPIGPYEFPYDAAQVAGQASDDGFVYVGGFTVRMRPDGTRAEVIGYNYRNSYEQTVTSFGDVFQNDNDDPPACRVSFVLEYGNAGFASADGQRTWRADQRPGQPIQVAEWRQEDPGTMPAGDVYGGGSPTGVAFYENGALGEKFQGLLLTCEAGRNVIFGYHPKLEGAGYALERFNFMTSNKEGEFAGSDFLGGNNSVTSELKTLFRPSDVVVGADGALYVTDWYDARVGGHQDLDESTSGTIYRVAPKGFKPQVPKLDLETLEGQIAALRSPAVNVRHSGFNRLKARGQDAVDAVAELLTDENPYLAARATWLLAELGPQGQRHVGARLESHDEHVRVTAYRALRHTGDPHFLKLSARMAQDPSPAVRREVALAMRNLPFSESRDILLEIARRFDGKDRTYLEALGTGCAKKEAEAYALFKKELGPEPAKWSPAMARIAWRLHPKGAVADLRARAQDPSVAASQRQLAMDALAFIPVQAAADAMLALTADPGFPFKADALWWLFNRMSNDWRDFGVMTAMKSRGIYDPDTVQIIEVIAPEPPKGASTLPKPEAILKLKGDAARGKLFATACQTCHLIGDAGVDFGPALTNWGQTQPREVILGAILNPSADIAHGYEGEEILTKDGKTIHGMVLANGDPVLIKSMGGLTQTIPKKRIKSRKKLNRSLMLSAEQLGLNAQGLADIVTYLNQGVDEH